MGKGQWLTKEERKAMKAPRQQNTSTNPEDFRCADGRIDLSNRAQPDTPTGVLAPAGCSIKERAIIEGHSLRAMKEIVQEETGNSDEEVNTADALDAHFGHLAVTDIVQSDNNVGEVVKSSPTTSSSTAISSAPLTAGSSPPARLWAEIAKCPETKAKTPPPKPKQKTSPAAPRAETSTNQALKNGDSDETASLAPTVPITPLVPSWATIASRPVRQQ